MKKLVTSLALFLALILGVQVDAFSQSAPTVNGLFHTPVDSEGNFDLNGTADSERYNFYGSTPNGSKLYFNVVDDVLYVALVVDSESVNDNVFDVGGPGNVSSTEYHKSAGWVDDARNARQLIDSEFAQFTLEIGTNGESFTWKQGYAQQEDTQGGPSNANASESDWVSIPGVWGDGDDENPPPTLTSSSSLVWNLNNYANNFAGKDDVWSIGTDDDVSTWKSPWKEGDENKVPNGYPEYSDDQGIAWEWSMVYEWSVDLSEIGTGNSPIFIISGASHHSPSKGDLEGDCPDDSDDDCFDDLKGAIGDFVWLDQDGDGIQDDGEPGVEDVEVRLFNANDIDPDNYTEADLDKYIASVQTDSNGGYLFNELDKGDYIVWFDLPDGYQFTKRFAGDNTDIDSNARQNPGFTDLVELGEGELRLDIDAGLIETTTTIELQGACYRMLSSPGSGASYSNLFADIFTQGANVPATKDDHIQDGDPNVWVWPTDNDGNSDEDWQALSTTNGYSQGLDTEIPAGTGVLLSMFEIRSLEDPEDDGPFLIDLSAFDEHEAPVNVSGNFINQTPDGWTLAGNPFFTSVDFNQIYADSDNINGVVYIWDRDIGDLGFGGWRTYSVDLDEYSDTDGVGDIPDGKIHPYQGFFVQTAESGTPNLKFTNDSKSDGAEFYGKQRSKNLVRLELSGDRGKASTWIVFGESGSFDRLSNDAFEMEPMASDYMMLASRKADGTLFDIGHYPMPGEKFEVPVSVGTSIPGNYTITATDFEMMIGQDLYFVDKETNTTLPLDESFSYDFTISNGAAKVPSPNVNRCSMEVNQMSKSAGNDRFVITTNASANVDNDLPQDVSLKQNYPNPFNPTTAIQYSLPESANVSLEVYNMLGQRVASIAEGQRSAGTHTVDFDASHLTSGVYIYRLTAGSTVINKRMTLVK